MAARSTITQLQTYSIPLYADDSVFFPPTRRPAHLCDDVDRFDAFFSIILWQKRLRRTNVIQQGINTIMMAAVLISGYALSGLLILAYGKAIELKLAHRSFLLAKVVQCTSWMLVLLRAYIPDLPFVLLFNVMLMAGAAIEMLAMMDISQTLTPPYKKQYLSLCILLMASFVLSVLFNSIESMRISLSSVSIAILVLLPAMRMITNKAASSLQRVVGVIYVLFAALLSARAALSLSTPLELSVNIASPTNSLLYAVLLLHIIASNMSFLLIDREHVDSLLTKAATIDYLTDIFNRQTFEKKANLLITQFHKREEPLSCLLLDIDDFKHVNDKYGHGWGDEFLRYFSAEIKKNLRSYDLFGRYGGEEFVILLPGANTAQARHIAERLRIAIENMRVGDEHMIQTTVSIGLSTILPTEETDIQTYYRISDKALYWVKSQGKNQVHVA